MKDIRAESGGTVNITVQGADCTGDAGAKLRVTYFWLDNYATGHAIAGYLPPALRSELGGNLPVVRNAVFTEMESLLQRFGKPLPIPTSDGGEGPEVSVCFQGTDRDEYGEPVLTCESEDLQTYGRELDARPQAGLKVLPDISFFVPLPRAEDVIVSTDRWPEDFSFSYLLEYDAEAIRDAAQNNEEITAPSIRLWRDARTDDLANLRSRLRSYARTFVDGEAAESFLSGFSYVPPVTRADRQAIVDEVLSSTTHELPASRFLEFISGGVLPPNLAYVYLADDACDLVWQFRMIGPEVKLLVAVVENAGSRPISVTAFDVSVDDRSGLRPSSGIAQAPDESWQQDTLRVSQPVFGPGEAVLVPLSIEFHARTPTFYPIGSEGEVTYEAIQELAADAPLRLRDTEFIKPAASFGPHVPSPQLHTFVFGPEIVLRAARLGEQQIPLRQIDPGAISMLVGYMVGSCPYVYGYDRSREEWRLQSRAIVGATNRNLAYEDSLALEHFDGRLRITEIDPEASFIDDITVRITLIDGSTVDLAPDDERLKARDGTYFVIAHPETVEIGFPAFAGIEQPVASVTARIFGYYREYGVTPGTVSSRAMGPMCRRSGGLL